MRDIQRTNELRIVEDYRGFYIQRAHIIITKSFFGLIHKKEIEWSYEHTQKDAEILNSFGKVLYFDSLDEAKKEMDRIRTYPKYHY